MSANNSNRGNSNGGNSNGGNSNGGNSNNEKHPEYKRMYSINGALEQLRDLYAKPYNSNDNYEIQYHRQIIEDNQIRGEDFLKEFEKKQAARNFVQQKILNYKSMPPKTRKNRKSKKSKKQRKNRKTRRN
jgi:hypothetical protein